MQPETFRKLYHQAREAYARGDWRGTVTLCDRVLREHWNNVECLNLRGLALHAAGQPEAAADSLAVAARRAPQAAGLQLNLGLCEWAMAQRRQARRHGLEAARLGAATPEVLHQAARLVRDAGDPVRAVRLATECIQRHPGFAPGWHLLGSLLLDAGEREAARAALERAVALAPGMARAWRDLVAARGDTLDNVPLVEQLRAIATGDGPPDEAASALFGLADLHERGGYPEQALTLWRLANRRARALRRFDAAAHQRVVARTLADSARAGVLPAADRSEGANLVFIIGMPRSGTTLLERALAGLPGVHAGGESPVMSQLEASLRRRGIDPYAPPGTPGLDAALAAARGTALDSLPPDHAKLRLITDKAPMNFELLGFIHRLFPRARFVHCRRDPLDVAWSCWRQDFQGGLPWAFDLDEIAGMLIAHDTLMAHWRRLLPHHIHAVDYERLVQAPADTLRALCGILEVDYDPAMLDTQSRPGSVATASREQVREPIHTGAVGRSAPFRETLEGLAARLRAAGIATP